MKRKNFLLTPLLAVPAEATFKNFAPVANLFKIELDFTAQLNQKEISKFVLNALPANYKNADPTETNFSLVATKLSGTNPMSLFANVKY